MCQKDSKLKYVWNSKLCKRVVGSGVCDLPWKTHGRSCWLYYLKYEAVTLFSSFGLTKEQRSVASGELNAGLAYTRLGHFNTRVYAF